MEHDTMKHEDEKRVNIENHIYAIEHIVNTLIKSY